MAEGYFVLPGTTGNYLSTPDSAALEITGDIEIVARVSANDWTPSTQRVIVSKWTNYALVVRATTGYLGFSHNNGGEIASDTTVAHNFIDGTTYWIKFTLDINNGAGSRVASYYYAADQETEPTSWTLIQQRTIAGTLVLQDSSAKLFLGALDASSQYWAGNFKRAIIRNGIGGTKVFDTGGVDVPLVTTATAYKATSGQTVTIHRSGSPSTLLVKRTTSIVYGNGVPSYEIIDQFEGDVVSVRSWLDIYDSDNTTIWKSQVPISEGTVSVDMMRSERRNFDVTIADIDDSIGYGPGAFWYDKVLKPYRGLLLANGDTWVTQLGEFMPDNITRPHFPDVIRATCRDFSKKLLLDKFADTTTFAAGLNVGTVIQTIATNGGITKFNFASTTSVLPAATTFERGDERWKAITDLAKSIGFEVFFNAFGYLTFRPFVDPLTAPTTYTYRTGADSNLISFEKSTSDTYMFNDVVVYGSASTNALVYARATNTNPSSPTRVAAIGRRLKTLESQFVADNTKALEIATAYLKVSGLEQFDMAMSSLVVPWLEAGDAVEVLVPSDPGDPTRYLLSNFSIPLGLGGMSGSAKRVTIVG